MPIKAECEGCGKAINARDDAAGRRIKCPECGDPINVPRGRRKKSARKKAARRRPEKDAGEPDFSNLNFGQLAAMERRGESLGKGTVEECAACGEPVGEFTEECPHCGEPHSHLKKVKRRAAKRKAAAQKMVIVEDKRNFETLARREVKDTARRDNFIYNFIYVIRYLWELPPTMAKIAVLFTALIVVGVILPLIAFNNQVYLDEGGPFGHNTTDTGYMVNARNDAVRNYHKARRELRKSLVEMHVLLIRLYDEGLLTKEQHDEKQEGLLTIAEESQLTILAIGKDRNKDGIIGEALTMATLAIALKQIVTAAKDALRSKDDEVVGEMMRTLFKVEVPRDE